MYHIKIWKSGCLPELKKCRQIQTASIKSGCINLQEVVTYKRWSHMNVRLYYQYMVKHSVMEHIHLGSIWNKNSWKNASKRSFFSFSHSQILGFHSFYSVSRAEQWEYILEYSYSELIPNERAHKVLIACIGNIIYGNQLREYVY